jgi:hypothetical protein
MGMNIKLLGGLLFIATMSFVGCSNKPATSGNSNSNQPSIKAYILRENFFGSVLQQNIEVSVMEGSQYIDNAAMTLAASNGTTVMVSTPPTYDNVYSANCSYQPGTTDTLTSIISGQSYTQSCVAPGGITILSGGSPISWASMGQQTGVTIATQGPNPVTTYTNTNVTTNPFTVPLAAYPAPGTYVVYESTLNQNAGLQVGENIEQLITH